MLNIVIDNQISLVSLFKGKSTSVDYLMPEPSLS